MDLVRDVCSSALSVRKAHGRRVRLPLLNVTVASSEAQILQGFEEIIKDEVNVREVTLTTDVSAVASHELQVVPAVVGPRLGKNTQAVIVAVKKGDWTQDGDDIVVAGERLVPGEYSLKMVTQADTASAALSAGRGIVLLDTELNPELLAEGLARDVIRAVQQARRDAQLDVSDRIDLVIGAETEIIETLEPHRAFISEETLSLSLTWDATIARQTSIEGTMIGVVVSAHR
jgi:isoleucyl-tRNA synthetase